MEPKKSHTKYYSKKLKPCQLKNLNKIEIIIYLMAMRKPFDLYYYIGF